MPHGATLQPRSPRHALPCSATPRHASPCLAANNYVLIFEQFLDPKSSPSMLCFAPPCPTLPRSEHHKSGSVTFAGRTAGRGGAGAQLFAVRHYTAKRQFHVVKSPSRTDLTAPLSCPGRKGRDGGTNGKALHHRGAGRGGAGAASHVKRSGGALPMMRSREWKLTRVNRISPEPERWTVWGGGF